MQRRGYEEGERSAPKLILVNARLILTLVRVLTCRVMLFSRITAPPCCRLRRLQFIQALPLVGNRVQILGTRRSASLPHL
jgi:hypothetical protein